MGTAKEPGAAKYFVAVLCADPKLVAPIETELADLLGAMDGRSAVLPWTASKFYQKEMGADLWRCLLSFAPLRSPVELAAAKLRTQEIEERYREPDSAGRRVNLDPGYLDGFKVVLASTKNAGQRIYLADGIYAEATLMYHDGAYHGLPYTYADYLWSETLTFFTQLRATYLEQLRQRNR